jgi:hypothetical protein
MALKVGEYVLIAMFGGLMLTGGSIFIGDLVNNYSGNNIDTSAFNGSYAQIGTITNSSQQLSSTVQNAGSSTLGITTAIINGISEVMNLIWDSVSLIFVAIGELFAVMGLPTEFATIFIAAVGVTVALLIIGLIWGREFI